MSNHRHSTWSTSHPDPLCAHFSSSSRIWGVALSSAPSISLGWRMTSCLWRNTGSVHSTLCALWPGLEGELKLYAVESSDFFFELFPDPGAHLLQRGSGVCAILFWYIHLPAPQEASNHPWSLFECKHIRLFVACKQVQDLLLIIRSCPQCFGERIQFLHNSLHFLSPFWVWWWDRSRVSWK